MQIEPVPLSSEDISVIFASSAAGVAASSIPVAYFLHCLGPRITFTVLLLISAAATAALPWATQFGLRVIVCARLVQGLFRSSNVFSGVCALNSHH
ncbi:unnamed protein product [Gongylonema pulchrum]|uniref:Major facilitator superfamily (MFS) profile domain-containing protein n=1 Tax=Gongylonema pulchrum TaxID=637853 RepID=A0A3P6R0A4_9BILA|nr:unnamed protein product [Gongylonema pulchrum]